MSIVNPNLHSKVKLRHFSGLLISISCTVKILAMAGAILVGEALYQNPTKEPPEEENNAQEYFPAGGTATCLQGGVSLRRD